MDYFVAQAVGLLSTSDQHISAEDIALGYKQLLRIPGIRYLIPTRKYTGETDDFHVPERSMNYLEEFIGDQYLRCVIQSIGIA